MHTHDDPNVFATPLGTDVFDWLAGDGFVMVGGVIAKRDEISLKPVDILGAWVMPKTRTDPMPSVADEVRALEGLIG